MLNLAIPARTGRWLVAGLLAGSFCFTASAQQAIHMLSPELFDALESHSNSDATLESVAIEQYPEVIRDYAAALESTYRGMSVDEHFAAAYPETYKAYVDGIHIEFVLDSADFLAFVMTQDEAYLRWQGERAMAGMKFGSFVDRHHSELRTDADRQALSPAQRGVSMREHVSALGNDTLLDELNEYLKNFRNEGDETCICDLSARVRHAPNPWQEQNNQGTDETYPGIVTGVEFAEFLTEGQGAGKEFDFYRLSKHRAFFYDDEKASFYSEPRVTMHCVKPNSGGIACTESSCTGELELQVSYASRVYQRIHAGGLWTKAAFMSTGDAAKLTYDPPGPAPAQTLFSKGIGVVGNLRMNWDPEAGLNLIKAAVQIGVTIADENSSWANALEGQLADDTFNGIIGLFNREGHPGSSAKEMRVSFDTANSSPFPLLPGQTLKLTLDTTSQFFADGYGARSESWGSVDSSHYIVGAAKNFQCSASTAPPTPGYFWLWSGGSSAPDSNLTLQNLVADWIAVELNIAPPDTSAPVSSIE